MVVVAMYDKCLLLTMVESGMYTPLSDGNTFLDADDKQSLTAFFHFIGRFACEGPTY